MIEAFELRIGNLLHADWKVGRIVKVKEIRETKIIVDDNDWSGLKHDEVSPIPLTPEILRKCGFDQEGIGLWKSKQTSFLSIHEEGNWTNGERNANNSFVLWKNVAGALCRVEYVHQLQNLFHALSDGEELNFKP